MIGRDRVDVGETATGRERDAIGLSLRVYHGAFRVGDCFVRVDFGGAYVSNIWAAIEIIQRGSLDKSSEFNAPVRPGGAEDFVMLTQAAIFGIVAWGASYAIVPGGVEDRVALEAKFHEPAHYQFICHGRLE